MNRQEAEEVLGAVGWSTREMSEYTDAELVVFAEEEEDES